MNEPLHILMIEDSTADFLMIERHLKQHGLSVRCRRVDSLEGIKEAIAGESWDLVLSDYNVPQLNFLDSLNLLQADLPEVPLILISGTVGEERAVELLKRGVSDFVFKENLARLVPAIERSLREVADLRGRRADVEALRQSEAKTRSILDNIGIGVSLISPRMEVLEMNQLMHEWFPAVTLWENCFCFRAFNDPPREAPCEYCPTQHTFRDGLVHEITTQTPHTGGERNYRIVSSPILNASGEVISVIEMVEDITEKLSLESQLRQAQKIEAIGQLAGGVAHDFNNILSAIFGYSHLIMNKVQESDPVKNYVEEIMAASQRAAVLTQSLLAFSRKQAVALAVIDINEVLRGNEAFLRRLIREDIELKIHCSEESLPVLADRVQIEQVLMNLVANSRDAMPDGGTLSIETLPVTLDQEFINTRGYGKAGPYASFSVSDNGIGMDKETQSRIFEPFFTTKEQGKGTGLGLAMAYGIVKKHEGSIDVVSEPGTGTTFHIYLPRVSATAEVDKREAKELVAVRGGTETILACEDDADVRKLMVNVLSHYGYRVIEAVDGQDAVEKFFLHQETVDLAIIDAIMPRKNGNLARNEMKTVRPDLKTIFVSGYARDIFEDNNTFDEHTIFLHKPYSPIDLLAKVRELLDRNSASSL